MSAHIFRCRVDAPLASGEQRTLDDDDSHHLARVVRRRPTDPIEVIDSTGALWPARIIDVGPPTRVEVVGPAIPPPEPAPVRLYVGLLDWGRLDAAHAQLAELGVPEVVLFTSERAGRTPGQREWLRRASRLDRVADAAARQSGSGSLPTVRGVVPFETVLDEILPGGSYLLHPSARLSLGAALGDHEGPTAMLVVGPEAGFTAQETARARERGATVCGLGRRVLRTGTAALVAVSAAMLALGALDPEALR